MKVNKVIILTVQAIQAKPSSPLYIIYVLTVAKYVKKKI